MKRSDPEIDAHIARRLKEIESRAESLQAVVRASLVAARSRGDEAEIAQVEHHLGVIERVLNRPPPDQATDSTRPAIVRLHSDDSEPVPRTTNHNNEDDKSSSVPQCHRPSGPVALKLTPPTRSEATRRALEPSAGTVEGGSGTILRWMPQSEIGLTAPP